MQKDVARRTVGVDWIARVAPRQISRQLWEALIEIKRLLGVGIDMAMVRGKEVEGVRARHVLENFVERVPEARDFGGVIRAAWPMHVRHGVEGPPVGVEPGLALHAGERLLELDQPLGWRAVAHDLGARTDELVVRRGSVAAVAELERSHA